MNFQVIRVEKASSRIANFQYICLLKEFYMKIMAADFLAQLHR